MYAVSILSDIILFELIIAAMFGHLTFYIHVCLAYITPQTT